jgi:hypothetical protein
MKLHQALVAIALPLSAFSNVTHAGAEKACPVGEIEKWQRSVVIAHPDQDIFEREDFSFKHTIQAILKSGGLNDDDAAQVEAVKSLIQTFEKEREKHPIGGRFVEFKKRAERDLIAKRMLDKESPEAMIPIGLFNRLDQAPLGWGYCGEHRIVYAKKTQESHGVNGSPGRFFLIFEAAVPNPRPEFGKEGCRPIAEMWQSLKTKTDRDDIAKSLLDFYYSGISNANGSIRQVLHIDHFGDLFGQVRGNFFMEDPWQLREWHIDPLTGSFRMHVLGTNPQPGLYGSPNPLLPPMMVKGFQDNFVESVLPQLLEADSKLIGVSDIEDQKALLIKNIGILGSTVAPWDDFVSNSQKPYGEPHDPEQVAEGAFKDKIKEAIEKANGPNVSPDQILVRAGAMSCGGCHHFSSRREIGRNSASGKIMWPESIDFVHINEKSELSKLLKDFFLADRCEKMNEIFFKPEGESTNKLLGPNILNMTLQQASPTPLLELRKQISSKQLEPALKDLIQQIVEERSEILRAIDRSTLGALGQIRHPD